MYDREAIAMALKALEYHQEQTRPIQKTQETIDALRQALAQPEQEIHDARELQHEFSMKQFKDVCKGTNCRASQAFPYSHSPECIAEYEAAHAQPEQEPAEWKNMVVANLVRNGINKHKARELADYFYTATPSKPWVSLTDEEIDTWNIEAIEQAEYEKLTTKFGERAKEYLEEAKKSWEQKPVAWMVLTQDDKKLMLYGEEKPPIFNTSVKLIPLYTASSSKEWASLTDGEIEIYGDQFSGTRLVREIEGLLRERNSE